MKSKNFGYIPALDHLRGFAALLVLFFHGGHFISNKLIYAAPYDPANWLRVNNPLAALVIEGHTAVSLFFVLSGFVFTAGSLHKELNYVGFFRNRFLRTYPLFLFFLTLGVLFGGGSVDTIALLKSVLFMANSASAFNGGPFTYVFWSIGVEWQFYLLFPFLLMGVQRLGWRLIPCLMLIFIGYRVFAYLQGMDMLRVSYWSIMGRMDQFLMGMLAALFYLSRFRESANFDRLGVAAAGLILLLLFGFNQTGGGAQNNYVWILWPTIEGAAWALFVIGYLSLARHWHKQVNRLLLGLGTISYSIYMVHYVVLEFFMSRDWDILIRTADPLVTAVLNILLLVAPVVVLISTLSYVAVERPFLRRRSSYTQVAESIEPT